MDLTHLLVEFRDYKLLQAEWLWLIIPLILFLFMRPLMLKKKWLKQNSVVNSTKVKHPYANKVSQYDKPSVCDKFKRSWQIIITLICGCLFLLTLAQPVKMAEKKASTPVSADIMLVIDTSISMVIRDYKLQGKRVDRMTMTQALLDRFVDHFSGKRVGIVIFGDPPQILLKPSKDKNLVRHLIHRLTPTIAGRMAALGDAVAIASDYIKSNDLPTETVLVLISDATSPSGKLSPIEGAKRAAESNTVLHTIAIGSVNTDMENQKSSQYGELLYEAADVKLLQQMAEITGGKSFHGIDVSAIDDALNQIEKRHQITTHKNYPRKQQALYYWPLLVSLLLLGLNELFNTLIRRAHHNE
ncbi:MAG: VWA domain-containing protein [Methylococcales bacterium]